MSAQLRETTGERTLFGREPRYAAGLRELPGATWAWMQPNGEWGESNAGLVVGDGEALLVDTLWDTALTARMLAAFEEAAGVPIRTLVNTHSDGDHVWGNQLVSDATIVSTAAAAAVIGTETPGDLERFRLAGRVLRELGTRAGAGRLRAVGAYFEGMIAPYDFGEVSITHPTRTFSEELDLDVGGRPVKLIEVGPAHTPGDAMALVPDARLIFAADIMFVGVTPVMWAGPVANWVGALDLILDADVDTIVPGHGPVCGKEEVEALRRYWVWLEAAARPRLGRGMSVAEAAADMLASDEFRAAEWAGWDLPERIVINVATLARGRRGRTGAVGVPARLRLLGQMANLARTMTEGR